MLDIWLFDFPKKQSPIPQKWYDFIFGNVFGRIAGCSRMGGFAKDEEEKLQGKMRKEDDWKVF